jgi:hypothetical protein
MMAEAEQDPETLKLMYDLARKGFEDQLTAARDVDAKIFQAFTAASVLIGLATLRGINLHGHRYLGLICVGVAVLAFLRNADIAIHALRGRKYRVPMDTPQIIKNYWFEPPNVLMDAFVHDAADAYAVNESLHKRKHRALRKCLFALLIEAAAIGASLIATNL